MKPSFPMLLAIGVAGCDDRIPHESTDMPLPDTGAARFPIGTYVTCAQGGYSPQGNAFLGSAGFVPGAVLTLSQSGSTVTATYVDIGGQSQSLSFTTATATSATLAQPGQVSAGFRGICVKGVGVSNQTFHPATMNVTAGAMTYDAGTVFVSLTGGLVSDVGDCGMLSQPDASFWLVCGEREGGPWAAGAAAPLLATPLPVGQYACSSQVESYAQLNGITHYVSRGAAGTLTLAQDGAKVSVAYTGDAYAGGTLRFGLTTATTAGAEAGQTLQAGCAIDTAGTGISSLTPEPLAVAAGSLSLVGSKLFVSFTGTLGASCADARVAGTLICSRQP